ncbi:hypothetical protein A2954_06035 [Candidatus Roizmanbacteria bacterium RIFCSPLOWO2_01_FULL_37_12]|uniref:Helix-turn-helix domain-containing protein n=1 Tax=Candidatus Roizmanbacteria bacterium RIFCSPLOWO2_01_FULL_37_12 TaxID=1802056 RepID=A0A1F7ICI4_9BACT|nr:MAG: hypothetical protein A2768_01195 [Candidatus Roizmanbacteria bacterium RIFCSPHIGHO2_01_FULL_37_16]OGK26044.1 MAG: hypothetical protein A3D76_00320 [Candidatus Roizmanbacteria bacterium RIFCSPHIGHO2_02_FULL_37_9b]OGK41063.1 MAG: hypothetical protein A2954_06035 [Candidatus Roizmanbacteria bacterium RIFCSPLOWO2_01_FULL_37_12]
MQQIVYSPEEISKILQVDVSTVYRMIKNGDLLAKKISDRIYRIPKSSLYWTIYGIDYDVALMEKEDEKNLPQIQTSIKRARKKLFLNEKN